MFKKGLIRMDIAAVIVDVPAKQTDREFDYRIPEKWKAVIAPGIRVIVPFGPRMVQGFVMRLKKIVNLISCDI